MALPPDYLDNVLAQLADLGDIEPRRMFGGCGFYSGGLGFAICFQGTLYFMVDAAGRDECRAAGLTPFEVRSGQGALPGYFAVPTAVLKDPVEKRRWFERAMAAAAAKRPAKKSGLAALRNIGPVSSRRLAAVGVKSREDLERRGVVDVWLAVRNGVGRNGVGRSEVGRSEAGRVSVNLLYALEGARSDRSWTSLSPAERTSLKQRAGLLP